MILSEPLQENSLQGGESLATVPRSQVCLVLRWAAGKIVSESSCWVYGYTTLNTPDPVWVFLGRAKSNGWPLTPPFTLLSDIHKEKTWLDLSDPTGCTWVYSSVPPPPQRQGVLQVWPSVVAFWGRQFTFPHLLTLLLFFLKILFSFLTVNELLEFISISIPESYHLESNFFLPHIFLK